MAGPTASRLEIYFLSNNRLGSGSDFVVLILDSCQPPGYKYKPMAALVKKQSFINQLFRRIATNLDEFESQGFESVNPSSSCFISCIGLISVSLSLYLGLGLGFRGLGYRVSFLHFSNCSEYCSRVLAVRAPSTTAMKKAAANKRRAGT